MSFDLTEKQEKYNVLVSRILTNKAIVGKGLWEMGLDLKEIKERELYLLEFRDFNEFLEKKVDIGKSTAHRCIMITTEFTLRDFMKWGIRNLEIIKRELPPDDRQDFAKKFYHGRNELEPAIIDYKVSRGMKAITRFTDQITSSPDINTLDERKLRIRRQYEVVEAHLDSVLEIVKNEIMTWIGQAKRYETDSEIKELIIKAEKRYKELK